MPRNNRRFFKDSREDRIDKASHPRYCSICGIEMCGRCGRHELGSYNSDLWDDAVQTHRELGANRPKACICYE